VSNVPHFATSLQQSMQAKAVRLAVQLTPMQRHRSCVLGCHAGLPNPLPGSRGAGHDLRVVRLVWEDGADAPH
jgi:hypothetical protein